MPKYIILFACLGAALGGASGCEKQRKQPAAALPAQAPHATWTTLGAKEATTAKIDELLADAKKRGWPVAIDFSAEWCTACHELDTDVLSHASVAPHLKPFLKLRIDATTETDEILAIEKRYKIEGLPTVVFIDAQGNVRPASRIDGYVESATFLAAVARVKG